MRAAGAEATHCRRLGSRRTKNATATWRSGRRRAHAGAPWPSVSLPLLVQCDSPEPVVSALALVPQWTRVDEVPLPRHAARTTNVDRRLINPGVAASLAHSDEPEHDAGS